MSFNSRDRDTNIYIQPHRAHFILITYIPTFDYYRILDNRNRESEKGKNSKHKNSKHKNVQLKCIELFILFETIIQTKQ